ncbi:unnamed protein product [Ectocarpus sp. 4 AP-2014]
MLRVGVVGLGRMGSGMALNVAKAGFPLAIYDAEEGRTQELREGWVKDKHLSTGPGGLSTPHLHLLESPADVMLASDVCLVCVHTEQQSVEALAGEDGLLAVGSKVMADKIIVDHGTVSPSFARSVSKAVIKGGGAFLDAPISGGPQGALEGTLSIMVGGKEEHLRTCMPVLEAMGSRIEHMGGYGAGAAAKLVNQHLVITNTVAACEAYVLARRLGLSDTAKLKALLGASWGHRRGRREGKQKVLGDLLKVEEAGDDVEVLRRSLAPIRTLGKDAAILARAAAESGASSSLLESAQAQIDETVRSGYSDCSFASVATTIEEEFCDAVDKEGDPR